MADQEIEHRLTSTVSGLRRGIASTRGLHASLRSEAKALNDFIPMLVEGARSGITSLLKHQASPPAHAWSALCPCPVAFEGDVNIWTETPSCLNTESLPVFQPIAGCLLGVS